MIAVAPNDRKQDPDDGTDGQSTDVRTRRSSVLAKSRGRGYRTPTPNPSPAGGRRERGVTAGAGLPQP